MTIYQKNPYFHYEPEDDEDQPVAVPLPYVKPAWPAEEPQKGVPPALRALVNAVTAPEFCERAAKIMVERGKEYDKENGERDMAITVRTFNAATGLNLTEYQGWLFMVLLKITRDLQRPGFHEDSLIDLVAYSALYAESKQLATTQEGE